MVFTQVKLAMNHVYDTTQIGKSGKFLSTISNGTIH